VALDADGDPTTDPEAALEGTILPFGGAKGAGLAVAVEVLAGGLVGAAMGEAVTGTYHTEDPCTKGDLFVVLDPDAFDGNFRAAAGEFLVSLKDTDPASGVGGVRLPGERSVRAMAEAETITVDRSVWEEIRALQTTDS